MLSANKSKIVRKRAKRSDGLLHNRIIDSACERFFRSRGMPLRGKFNHYLFDGVPPDKEFIARAVAQGVANAGETGLGMWFLEDVSTRYAGCVELLPYPSPRSAELIYLLDPRYWGQGLALRMAWTAISHAFLSSQIGSVIAGTDLPNTASLALMRRLGMRFHKDVDYPLGAGVEYVIRRDDIGSIPKPDLISIG